MKTTTPYALGVAAVGTFGISPFWGGVVAVGVSALYVLWRIVRMALSYHGPTVIDPDSPPYVQKR